VHKSIYDNKNSIDNISPLVDQGGRVRCKLSNQVA